MNPNVKTHTEIIKNTMCHHGFSFCGISKSGFLQEEEPRLTQWLKNNFHGKMTYMENHFDKRLDTTKLVEGSKSVISVLCNYYTDKKQNDVQSPKISKYAFGEDYHHVIKDKLVIVIEELQQQIGKFDFRVFTDSAPVLDKAWAKKKRIGMDREKFEFSYQRARIVFFYCRNNLRFGTGIRRSD